MPVNIPPFESGPIRPPDEADSLLIRTTRGCPWNRCHFCTLFKGMRFSVRPVADIKKDIIAAREHYGETPFKTCFLQDGDSFAMKTKDLLEILETLRDAFPSLTQISSYGRAQTMLKKSASEIQEICDAGLNMLYSGVESGSDEVLSAVRKGVTSSAIIESSLKAKQAGINLMVFVISGLGGKEMSSSHIRGTARVLNAINPENIRMMTLAVKPETELAGMIGSGAFTMLSEVEMIKEQREMICRLEGISSRYGNYHGVNLLNEITGVLPEDKDRFISTIDALLSLPDATKLNFILGKRSGYYHRLSGFEKKPAFPVVQKQVEKITHENPVAFESIFHDLRNRVI